MTAEVFLDPIINLRVDVLVGAAGSSRWCCDSFFSSNPNPFCICDIKQTMKRSSWRFNKRGERPTFPGGEVFAPLEEWIVAFLKSCLMVIAPDFRIPPPKFFCFVLPSCAFPSGIVSEHNGSACLHCEADIVTEDRPEAFSLVKLNNALWMYDLRRNPCSFYLLMLSVCWRINFEWFFFFHHQACM